MERVEKVGKVEQSKQVGKGSESCMMVQIFVKMDGCRTIAMEVSPEDKVQKTMNTVSGSDWDVYVMCEGRILAGFETGAQCRS